jgi:hypothetical protein
MILVGNAHPAHGIDSPQRRKVRKENLILTAEARRLYICCEFLVIARSPCFFMGDVAQIQWD